MTVRFTVPGEPRGKGRPRFSTNNGKIMTHTPSETVVYENLVVTEYEKKYGSRKFDDSAMLDMRIMAYYSIPKSKSKKAKKAMENGEIRPITKPDADNILKVVADGLNKIAYRDDAQVVDTQVRKFYSHTPRVEVMIQAI